MKNTARKNSPKIAIVQLCRAISSQLRSVSTIGKNLLSSNISSTRPHNMVNFGPLVRVALRNRADHYIFMLWFVLSSSSSFFFSSPNLSRRRLDVCHISTHDVALVRISDAYLKPAARGWLKTQDAKKSPKIAIWAPSHNFVGVYLRN